MEDLKRYKKLNKQIKIQVKYNIRVFEENLALNSRKNPKSVYSYMNSKTRVKESIKAIKLTNGTITTDIQEIVNELNEFFASVFTKDETVTQEEVESIGPQCLDPKFDKDTVQKCLENLNIRKSFGPDCVHPKVLKECAKLLSVPLALIFNCSFKSGVLPKEWSIANLVPLFKKGNKLESTYYRPVSLTSIFCKTMERIIRDEMMTHLVKNNLIADEQHGFVHNTNVKVASQISLKQWIL